MDHFRRMRNNKFGLENGAAGSIHSPTAETLDPRQASSAQAAVNETADIKMPSPSQNDLESIWIWNKAVPLSIDRSIPEMIEERVKQQPDALAVSAWDGELTYAELDRLTSLLAGKLASLPSSAYNALIPLFFEKSKWTVVAMLGVLKAGAAFVLLDPSLPHGRLESIVDQVKASFMLSSALNAPAGRKLVRELLIIDCDFFKTLSNQSTHCRLPLPRPSSTMYAVFTSGSTGTPKGVIITHRNHASALHYQAKSMGITSKTRIFDFSSYSFDLSIFNAFSALTLGGCLCVPSEHDRRDRPAESMQASHATWVYLTPTVARQLSPDQLPDLETLVLIGETVHTRDLVPWRGSKVRVINTYGPSECTTASTINTSASTLEEAVRIGKGTGMNTWIVDPDNNDSLMPLGLVGELILEGPLVGNGYLGDPEKTSTTFISDPAWLLQGLPDTIPGRQGRLYKTGDLVRYNSDGSLSFVGRKDNQVKIRGNRVELGEIECVVLDCMPEATQVVVELIVPQNSGPMLAAFLKMNVDAAPGFDAPEIFSVSSDVKKEIAGHLPGYMMPTVFFTARELPLTPSGKADRRRLRDIGAALSSQQLAHLQAPGRKIQPETKAEELLQKLWSQVLHIDPASIGLDDGFFQLGGDSLIAMKLVAEARKAGLRLTVADIFRQPRLHDVASQSEWLTETHAKSEQVIAPFALLREAVDITSLLQDVAAQSHVDASIIKDAYPCTPLQEGLFSLSSKAGDYIMQGVLELSCDANLAAFQAAWEQVVRDVAILRTRIVHIKNHDRLLQIVLDEPLQWITTSKRLDKYLEEDKKSAMELGQPLTRFALIQDGVEVKWFVWTMYHSLYDEWSLSLLLEMVNRIYAGKAVEPAPPFQPFIQYLQSQSDEAMKSYWSQELDGCEAASFPALPPSVEQPVTDRVIEHTLPLPLPLPFSDNTTTTSSGFMAVTAATLIRAAWALIVARMTSSDEVVFGATVSGRSAPVADIHALPFPTIATIPVRIRIPLANKHKQSTSVSEYLAAVQQQSVDVIPYEQYGLHRIAKISSNTELACGFQTLLVIQPQDNDDAQSALGKWRLGNEQQSFNTYGLILEIHLRSGSVAARASFDSRVIQPWLVKGLLDRLEFTVGQLGNANKPLRDIQAITPQELQQIWAWNSVVPQAVELSIPKVIRGRALAQPDAPAICAWDGEITYSELERLASILASRLFDLGVRPGTLVPLHFEKSMWTTVAILAVLKARGGFVLLDPSLPEQRLKDITRQVGAKLTVSSYATLKISERLTEQVVVVDRRFFNDLETSKPRSLDLKEIDPSSIAYVIFTSGSMGIPKGVMVTHRNIVTAVPQHIKRLGYAADSRIYDFASYSFGAAINNVMAALISGACLCVPSDNDRRSNLAGSLVSLRATVVLLTPSVAESLSPQKVPTLRSIIFGGEAVRMKDVMPWWGHVKVITAYGSSEVTTISTINPDATCPDEVLRIGKGAGGVTWVVDPEDHEVLLPPGCIGELLLEGPLVGLGYLNDVAKTSAAFIESPRWLSVGADGNPGRLSRIYKTGDLVRYHEDGSLSYIGRKDAQIKIRGQRVELGEVEAQVQHHLPDAKQVVAEVISPQAERFTPTLVVFIQNKDSVKAADEDVKLLKIPSDVEKKLAEYLPSYMVPAVFFIIKELPMTPTGKMNRRRLREIGATFTMKQLIEVQTVGKGSKRQPQTELEQKIQNIWSQVLNTDSALIGLDDSFFQLGGDSITAMQVASLARTMSVQIRVADILREKTICNIARIVNSADTTTIADTRTKGIQIDAGPSQLSPMQRLYFHLQTDPTACFDQFFHLKLRRSVDAESLSNALENIVQRHDILRSRFRQNEMGFWEQLLTNNVSRSFHLHVRNASDPQSSLDAISQCREHLDIQNGPMLSALLSNESGNYQTLFIDIHHLVIDLVSWRVILQELEEYLTIGSIAMREPSVDFLSWSAMQAHYVAEKMKVDVPFSFDDQEHFSYWGLDNKSNSRGGIISREFVIDEAISSIILGSGNDVLRTRPLELMMSALFYSFHRVFSERRLTTIYSEGHGRESWDDNLDVSTTAGWFSTIFPVKAPAGANISLKDIIRQTKDSVRRLQHNGWSHFTSRFADEASAAVFAKEYPVEILFNYAGLYQQLERSDGLFEQIHRIPGECSPPSSMNVQRFALFDIDAQVERGQIVTSIEFHKDMHHQDNILSWIKEFENSFGVIARELNAMSADWTLSDFPLAFQSYDAIQEFREKTLAAMHIHPEDVEDIFPCAPLQEGILLSQAKEAVNYQRWVDFEVQVDNDEARLDTTKLEQAWRAVVKRHPLLRAVLFDTFPGTSKMMHAIIKDPAVNISLAKTIQDVDTGRIKKHGLQHHLTIYDVGKRNARLRLEMNHAITDGVSQSIICRDLQSAYNYSVLSTAGSYKDFITYLEQEARDEGLGFWKETLAEIEPCHLPVSSMDDAGTQPFTLVDVPGIDIGKIRKFCATWDITPATVIQTAWALVLNTFTGAAAPCFGNLFSGRDVSIRGVDDTLGPFIGLVPFHVRLNDKSSSVLETLRQVQEDYLKVLPYQHFPLTEIHRALGLGSRPLFNTLLSFQRVDVYENASKNGLIIKEVGSFDPTEYDVTIDVMDSSAKMDIQLNFRPGRFSFEEATRLVDCISIAISEIIEKPNKAIKKLSFISKADLDQLKEWNATVPEAVDQCVHDLIESRVRSQPDATAVCSWDGELTYIKLDRLANGLAGQLIRIGVKEDMIVPLCFEKSLWTPVAMLATLKAGGAFVLLDTSLPEQRLQAIITQTEAKLILSSNLNLDLSSRLCKTVVKVSAASIEPIESLARKKPQLPSAAMFAIFTSGSTGTPKGVVLTHANFSTSLKYQAEALGFTKDSRVFDFSSYAFDIAVHNALASFVTGACLCIPSDEDRKSNLAGSMRAMKASVADLTPSVARLIEPSAVPDLKTLILAGEAVTVPDASRWWGKAHVINAYGPAECHVSTINANSTRPEEVVHVGKGAGLLTWIVDPENYDSLVPIGCPGELLLDGPLVGRGYIGEPERTAAVFLDNPSLLLKLGHRGRVYKTGDLVRYDKNGNLIFLGRKDSQVKIHGQRVELGEVEHRVQECFPEAAQIIAEVITFSGNKTLAAFIQMRTDSSSSSVKIMTVDLQVKDTLSKYLPQHMIPKVFFSIPQLPMTTTGKVNRRTLREIGASFLAQEVAEMQTLGQSVKHQPETEIEQLMQIIWARVLNISTEVIGPDDGFFQLGGDSIGAMKVVAEARKMGLQLAVVDVFHHTTLRDISLHSIHVHDTDQQGISPFSLLPAHVDSGSLIHSIKTQYHIDEAIQDIYPCTPIQEGLFSLSLKRSGDYVLQSTLELSRDISLPQFRIAWEEVARTMPILRTRIIQDDSGLKQVILSEEICWLEVTGLEAYLEADRKQSMNIGQPLARYALVKDDAGRVRWFVWTVHHVLYDGWSEPLIIKAVNRAYQGQAIDAGPQFQAFVKYIKDQHDENMLEYWKNALEDNEAIQYPRFPTSPGQPFADKSIERPLPRPKTQTRNVTTSSLIRAALALVIGKTTNTEDVVYGVTVSGRSAPVVGVEKLVAPTIATVPVRMRFSSDQNVENFLQAVQQQSTEMILYEQMGLHEIAQISADSQQACDFQTLLVIQPQESNQEDILGKWHDGDQQRWFNTFGLVLVVQITVEGISIKASFDSRLIEESNVLRLLQRLEYVMTQLDGALPDKLLGDIKMVTPEDLAQIWKWNETLPEAADLFVHEMIADFARSQPGAPAICAWDGDFTYRELDDLSSKLSSHLFVIGARPGTFVGILFEKSKWTTVAMLAVMKSTASFVLLDPSLPVHHLESIVNEVEACLIVSSPFNASMGAHLCQIVTVLDDSIFAQIVANKNLVIPPRPDIDAVNYVVFTSGTTGKPKGAVISHRSSASAVKYQVEGFGYTKESRVYDFSNYSFDGSHLNAYTVLAAGGCLCVPTDHDRKNRLGESMESLNANAVFLTPTVAELLDPAQLPHLKSMILGGEAIRVRDIKPWWDTEGVRVFTIYGTSECTPVSMVNPFPATPEDALGIGMPYGVCTWVVDPNDYDSLVPVGCIGELLVEGPLVGNGYLNDPAKTAAAFIADPAWLVQGGREGRLYRTGDLVHYKQDGSLAFMGRRDSQVKIRGQRVELGDVEHQVQECMPAATQVIAEVIVPQGEKKTSPILVAFLQINAPLGQEESEENLVAGFEARMIPIPVDVENKLAQKLPSYMVPTIFFTMAKLPVGTTGKMDRKKLRQIGSSFSAQQVAKARRNGETGSKRQPETKIEVELQKIWAQVLDIEPASVIGLDDSFFKLGGNSIAAMKLVGEARKFGFQVAVADVFRYSRLHQLAGHVSPSKDIGPRQVINRSHLNGPVEQSFAQGRLWFVEQLHPGLTWYLMPCVMRLEGPLNIEALGMALLSLERRHETLRTVFSTVNGVNMQQVLPVRAEKKLTIIEMSLDDKDGLTEALRKDETTPFDLEKEPGWRTVLYKLGAKIHVLSLVMHHIISDGWSVDILRKELASFYSAALCGIKDPLSHIDPLPIQYRDFSVWEKTQDEEHERQLEYWAAQLETSQPAEFFCDKPRPEALSGHADVQTLKITGDLYESLQLFCQEHHVTPFIALLGAFRATHYRLTGQDDATIGSPNANRDHWEIKDVIGFFVNMQCLRIRLEDEALSFEQLAQQVKTATISSLANQNVPFERIVSKLQHSRDLSRHPLVQVVFAVHSQLDLGQFTLENVKTQYIDQSITSRFDLECHFFQERDSLRGEILYSTDLYVPETITNLISVFNKLLSQVLKNPKAPLSSLPLMTDAGFAELHAKSLIEMETTNYPRDLSVVEVFQRQVALCPDRVAVRDRVSELTYAELDQKSDDIAYWLRRYSFPPEKLIGVVSNHSCLVIVAFLGIMKANLAYLPFDPKVPMSRMDGILSSIEESSLVLVGPGFQPPPFRESVNFVRIEDALEEGADEARKPNRRETDLSMPTPTSLAYVMFTSGSTGRPKGVMIEHRSIVRLVKDTNVLQHPLDAVMGHISNIAFDGSTWEVYCCLLNGGTLICIDTFTVLDQGAMSIIFTKEQIRVLFITPALLKQYLAECPAVISVLRTMYIGGERLDIQDLVMARALMGPDGKIICVYGPTENTGFSTLYPLPVNDKCANGVAIGRSLSNSGAYVMDLKQQLVPLGVVGELVVTGDGLARGYTLPQLNADRFASVSLDGKKTIRGYRTGDYVRSRPSDGMLEFLGRIDGQIKLRGQRVELGEIESLLRSHKSVDNAATVLQKEEGRDAQLVAFVTLRNQDVEEMTEPDGDPAKDDDVAKQVDSWEEMFDEDTYADLETVQSNLIGRDFIGWTSMYDGSDIDKAEMGEWLDDTIQSIINGSTSLDVLEIGSGSGMIALNLTQALNSYVGLDPSQKAVSLISQSAKGIPGLSDKVRVYKGTATDIAQLGAIAPNLVIVNSVAQYFPSQEYLLNLISDALQLESVTTLFFGDMRSYAMYEEFQVTKALFRSSDGVSKDQVRYLMSETEQSQMELLVDPGFFTSLPLHFPNLIHHVEIIPKRMVATNELSCYRFAAVIHVHREGQENFEIHHIDQGEWIDFEDQKLDRTSLMEILRESAATVALKNIPHSKTIFERFVIDALKIRASDDSDWLADAYEKAAKCASLAATDLEALAKQTGYSVEISWARQFTQRGGLDAIFHKYNPGGGSRILFNFPTDHQGRSSQTMCNRPLQQRLKQRIREQLQERLETQLPSYMIPKVIAFLEKMPVNDNGKVDRRALMDNVQRRTAGRASLQQPTTETENQMQKIWAKVLHLNPTTIGLLDSFFTIGGDSLAAMKIVGEARKAGFKLAVADIFRGSTLQEVARRAKVADGMSGSIPKAQVEGPVEQSFAQRRLWFLEQLYPGLTWYLMPCAIRLRGSLHLDALRKALSAVEARHDTLRTTFEIVNGVDMQVVKPFHPKYLSVIDVLDEEALEKALHKDHTAPMDLLVEPGWRVALYRIGGDDESHVLSIVMHHIISDGWSVEVLQKELAKFYKACVQNQDPLSMIEPLPIQYRDFSVWQRSKKQVEEHDTQLNYWVKHLETSQAAEFFCDKPRPATLSGRADVKSLRIQGKTYQKLQKFCKSRGLTLFVVLLAAFRATHFRLTGVTDGNIGTVNANRDRWEVKDLIGFFVNMQSIRIQVEGESFEELVRQVHRVTTDSFANQHVPFENIVSKLEKERDLSRHPLSQIIFAIHSQMDLGSFKLDGLDTAQIAVPPTTRFDMEFHVFQEQDALQGEVLFSTDLFAPETISNMLSVFSQILERSLDDPRTPIVSLPLLAEDSDSPVQKMDIVSIARTGYPRDSSIIDLFRGQVALYPEKIAVKDLTRSELTYQELDGRSDTIAHWLASKYCLAPETLVGVFCSRSCESVCAFMGVLKAHLAYLPFHLKLPQSQMESILSSIPGRKIVLVGSEVEPPSITLEGVEFVRISDALEEQAHQKCAPLEPLPVPLASSLAYVIFTSGSTGRPKGVMIEHRGIVRLVRESNMAQHLPPNVVMAHLTNIAFDVSAWEMYGALLNGGTLICIDAMMLLDPRALSEVFNQEDVQSAIFTPAILKSLLEQAPAAIRPLEALYVAGDKADADDLSISRGLMKGNAVINAYGPTENSVISTLYALPEGEKCLNGVPIGQAISNSGAFVMDRQQRLVPAGVIGELVVTGDGLARGYLDPQQDINRFVMVSINGEETKAYRTGDYVRRRPIDGEIEFFGRIDGQIKIRGHRVELGEIEHALRNHKVVNDAVAVLQREEGHEPQIVGFVTVGEEMEDAQGGDTDSKEHVKVWEELFDAETYQSVDQVKTGKIGRDFIGWKSMYDGSSIDQGEMNEWLDETIKAITLSGGEPRRVLEIGTGTGMILFNLLNHGLLHYTGFEPSEQAVKFILKTAKAVPTLADKIHMHKGTAADISKLPSTVAPNLVIINSVAQYFPSQEYLAKVVEDILTFGSVETIFFGDIRSHALYREFRASKILFAVADDAAVSKDDVRQRMVELERTELELLVDPAFFTALASRLPRIEHVEILPKKMRATNELSSYRYDVVLHVKLDVSRRVHGIRDDQWIDYAKQKLDKALLFERVQVSGPEVVAVSNIPYRKTIFERFALESLDKGADNQRRRHWIPEARQRAQECSSMDAADLVALAEASGCRVEVSWARQYSQRGGLDAVFHHFEPDGKEGSRVLFQFPTEHHGRPSHSLTSRPLRQQRNQMVQNNLYQMLQAQLPPYMVPQAILVLDKLPLNDNGKVDRKYLAARRQTRASLARGALRKPSTYTELQMQKIWSQVLNIDESEIGLDSSFFHLGGNSITAMKVVSDARKLGFQLVVADMFNYDTIEALSRQCTKLVQNGVELDSVVLVESATKARLLEEIDALGLDVRSTEVANILPLTSFQEKCVHEGTQVGQHGNYFYLDLGMNIDVEKFKASCALVLDKFPILRARFLRLGGVYWQVVLHNQPNLAPVRIQDAATESLDEASDRFCVKDMSELASTGFPLSFTILQHKDQGSRLILRVSHAQYDGISFPIILQSLMDGYNNIELSPGPDFSKFLAYSSLKREISMQYWKELLRGSSLTALEPAVRPRTDVGGDAKPKRVFERAEMDLPRKLPSRTTSASVISAAWAILLSLITGQEDVVYGNVVTGRNSAMQGVGEVVGACFNIIPVRVSPSSLQTPSQLLLFIQEQSFSVGEADTLSYGDIIKHCTDWPAGSDFDAVIQHQNVDEHPEIRGSAGEKGGLSSSKVQFYGNPDHVPVCFFMASYPMEKEKRIEVQIFANTHIMRREVAGAMARDLGRIVGALGTMMDEPMGKVLGGLELEVRKALGL